MNTVLPQESNLVQCIVLKMLSSWLLPQFH